MSRKNHNLEKSALKLIFDSEGEGILQSEMWKKLGVSSREGSRLSLKFEERGIIERRKVLSNGRWTYKLFSKRKPVVIGSIRDCPCLRCDEIERCFLGSQVSAINCLRLTEWIKTEAERFSADSIA